MAKQLDSFVTITVKPGPDFYKGKRPETHAEMARLYEEHAKQYTVLRELFTAFAGYHWRIEPPRFPPEPQGDSDNLQVGGCDTCTSPSQPTTARAVTFNGVDTGQCYPCE